MSFEVWVKCNSNQSAFIYSFLGGHNFQADSKILVKKQRAKVDKTILKNNEVEDSHCQFKRYCKATAMSRVY